MKTSRVSSAVIKNTACVLMVLGAIGGTIISELEARGLFGQFGQTNLFSSLLVFLGKTSLVLFVFLLTEGLVHTESRGRYLLRILVCAVMSELPFDLYCFGTGNFLRQNVLFTYLIAMLTVMGLEAVSERFGRTEDEKKALSPAGVVLSILTVFAGMLAAELIRGEYGCMCVLLAVVFFLLKERRILMLIAGLAVCFLGQIPYELIIGIIRHAVSDGLGDLGTFIAGNAGAIIVRSVPEIAVNTAAAIPGCILLYFYNGKKGYPADKIVYYILYPLHMLFIMILTILMMLIIL